jgi:hypothetical protein
MSDERTPLFHADGGWCAPSDFVKALHGDELPPDVEVRRSVQRFGGPEYIPVSPVKYPSINLDESTIEFQVDVGKIVSEMVDRIMQAEDGVREQVMVEWLRSHGWKVERDDARRD